VYLLDRPTIFCRFDCLRSRGLANPDPVFAKTNMRQASSRRATPRSKNATPVDDATAIFWGIGDMAVLYQRLARTMSIASIYNQGALTYNY
jgi:hypothetical protein